jgi:hypothetical protein
MHIFQALSDFFLSALSTLGYVISLFLAASCSFFSSSSFVLCSTTSIVSCIEDFDDGKQVLSEFFFWELLFIVFFLTVNQQFRVKLLEDVLQEVIFKSTESVSLYDDHFGDHSLTNQDRELLEPHSLKVDAIANLLDNFMFWVFVLEVLHLPLQLFFLLGLGHSGIAELLPLFFPSFPSICFT